MKNDLNTAAFKVSEAAAAANNQSFSLWIYFNHQPDQNETWKQSAQTRDKNNVIGASITAAYLIQNSSTRLY